MMIDRCVLKGGYVSSLIRAWFTSRSREIVMIRFSRIVECVTKFLPISNFLLIDAIVWYVAVAVVPRYAGFSPGRNLKLPKCTPVLRDHLVQHQVRVSEVVRQL